MGQRFRQAFAARWCPSGKATRGKDSNHVSHRGRGARGCKVSHSEWPKRKGWTVSDGVDEKQSELSGTTGGGGGSSDSISCV